MYYIRRKSDPTQYIAGTPTYRHWKADNGRLFSTIGKLRAFITSSMNARNNFHSQNCNMSDWEIVEVEMVVKDVKELTDIVKPKQIMELLKQ